MMERSPRGVRVVGGLLATAVVLALATGFTLSSRPSFLGGYSGLTERYVALEESAHKGLECAACHATSPGGYRAALLGDFYGALAGKKSRPAFVEFKKPSREACLACHEHDWSMDASRTQKIPHPAHLRVADEKRECVGCHKWTAHQEEYMENHKTMPYSAVCAAYGCHVGAKQEKECVNCHHGLRDSLKEWKAVHPETVRSNGPGGCLEACHKAGQCRQCHTTGTRPDFQKTVASRDVKSMERAHVKDDWLDKHGDLALRDEGKCLECHVSVSECESCHSNRPAFHGLKSTWLGRHKDLSKDPRRCTVCHEDQSWCGDCHRQFKEMR